jgi:Ni,Fe-hydrogenase III small subunit
MVRKYKIQILFGSIAAAFGVYLNSTVVVDKVDEVVPNGCPLVHHLRGAQF